MQFKLELDRLNFSFFFLSFSCSFVWKADRINNGTSTLNTVESFLRSPIEFHLNTICFRLCLSFSKGDLHHHDLREREKNGKFLFFFFLIDVIRFVPTRMIEKNLITTLISIRSSFEIC